MIAILVPNCLPDLVWLVTYRALDRWVFATTLRILLNLALLVMMWQARRWAILVTKLLCGIGSLHAFFLGLFNRDYYLVAWAFVVAGVVILLQYSRSVNAFFEYQRESRRRRGCGRLYS